jgi:hypothetical protein
MRDYVKTATEIGKLVTVKQEAYGDSFSKSEEIIKILFPNGVKPENYRDLLTITRIIDKLFRIATRKNAFGESPYRDIAGYALLGIVSDLEEEKKNTGNGKARTLFPVKKTKKRR